MGRRISVGHVRHVALAALAIGAVLVHVGSAYALVAAAVVVLALACAAADRRDGRIPNAAVAAGALAIIVLGLVAGTIDDRLRPTTVGAVMGVISFALPLLAVHITSPDGMGLGDVKLGAVLGAGLGAGHVVLAPLALLVACGAAIIRRVATGRLHGAEPFGPALAIGTCTMLLVARPVVAGLGFHWLD